MNNQYLVGRKLGNGGFGITYIGRDLFLDRIVAIKEYFPNSLAYRGADGMTVAAYNDNEGQKEQFEHGKQRTIAEAQTVVKMSDLPHVVKMYNAFLANGTAYIVMEYITGETLASCISREGKPMKWQRAAELLLPLLTDLQQMHDKNFIHRDISPDNIMIRKSTNKAVLLDFGAARDFHSEYTVAAGTWRDGYTPIEQYSEELVGQDGRTDEYSFCATMYFALTGKKPASAQFRAFSDQIEPPRKLGSDIDPARETVLMQGFSTQKEQRYPTVTMLAQALQDPASVQWKPPVVTPDAPPEAVSEQIHAKKSGKKGLLAVIAAVVVAAAGIVGVLLFGPSVTVSASNIAISQQVEAEDAFALSGEIKAKNGQITYIFIELCEGDLTLNCYHVKPNAASYQLQGSELNALLESVVASLPDGEYTCRVSAMVSNRDDDEVLFEETFRVNRRNTHKQTAAPAVQQPTASPESTPTPSPTPQPTPEPIVTPAFEPISLSQRKLLKVNDIIRFGRMKSDKNSTEDIEWIVLDIRDGKALLLSRYVYENLRYRKTQGQSITWQSAEARDWIKTDFMTDFSTAEMQGILAAGHDGDPVFLLTKEDVEKYLMNASNNMIGQQTNGEVRRWMLMSEGVLDFVDENGKLVSYDNQKKVERFGVRPAVWVHLEAIGYETVKPLNRNVRAGDSVSFGSYMYDENGAMQPVEWIVISRENDHVKLLSRDLLDSRQYHEEKTKVSWQDCSLRSWLNSDFVNTAFTSSEQNALVATRLGDYEDRVYLLSKQELESLFPQSDDRVSKPTRYAEAAVGQEAFWWLRITGETADKAPVVNDKGDVYPPSGNEVTWKAGDKYFGNGIRPVITVDLNLL